VVFDPRLPMEFTEKTRPAQNRKTGLVQACQKGGKQA
jgi:hypothetical protein